MGQVEVDVYVLSVDLYLFELLMIGFVGFLMQTARGKLLGVL